MMNERIQELARQAFINAGYDTEDELFDILFKQGTEFHEKFAELIVRECAEIASEETSLPYDSYSEKIKQHFGVEE